MTDMRIAGIGGAGNPTFVKNPDKTAGGGFDNILKDAVGKISQVQKDAEVAVKELSGGDVTSAVLSMEKADMTFQLMVEVRNRLLTAYEEIMRMSI